MGQKGGPGGLPGGGTPPLRGGPHWRAVGGPGGALEGGGPPPGGGPEGGGPPPGGVKKGSKGAKKWQTKGVPLVRHFSPWEFPIEMGPGRPKKRSAGPKKALFGGVPPPWGGSLGGAPPPRGGGFGAYRPVLGGGPPLGGGPRGVYRGGPPGASIWQQDRYQLGGNHATLSKFRPKI